MSQPIINVDGVTSWTLDVSNRIAPLSGEVRRLDLLREAQIEGTLTVDKEAFDRFVFGHDLSHEIVDTLAACEQGRVSVQIDTDHNPWHRGATGWARARKVRDGVWWTFQRRALRRRLIERTTIIVPNCRMTSTDAS